MRFNYYKLRQLSVLQSAMVSCYKLRHGLLEIATGITKCDGFITNCDRYYKVRWLLQIATVHPAPGQRKTCKCPTPGTDKPGKCPAVTRQGGGAQLELIDALLKHLHKFKQISGLEINTNKTKALWLGCWRSRKVKPFGFKWPQEPVHALGIHFFYDLK